MRIKVTGLTKTFEAMDGPAHALQGVDFEVQPSEFYTLLGPSGCGKSTTLRCIAGLERPNSGEIIIGDRVVASPSTFVPPNDRPIGMVFQSYAIWPHMTVFKNVAFPLKQGRPRPSQNEVKQRVTEALALVQMEHLADRPAPYLSGGQQQRVALARALVSKPQLLLLDEPLSNLDAKLREELRFEVKELVRRLGITTLYVTHDQIEALAMSDRIAVMLNGRILQESAPKQLYLEPRSKFVAQFVGQVNFFEGTLIEESTSGLAWIDTEQGRLSCALAPGVPKGGKVWVTVRPESIELSRDGDGGQTNIFQGKVVKAVFLGDIVDCQIQVGKQTFRAKLPVTSDLAEGDQVYLRFNPKACVVLQHD
ncbi:MAG: ABC transporter ATP-binding protein [Candidatus Binatia bacterium]